MLNIDIWPRVYRLAETKNGASLPRKEISMELKVFSIRDAKTEVYNVPFFQKSHGEAERTFAQLARDDKSQVAQFPEDYDLYFLGTYDDSTGKVQALDSPQHVVKAVDVKASLQ